MACPTCDHTMHRLSVERPDAKEVGTFWCPRCGTIKEGGNEIYNSSSPMLVERCRQFKSGLGPDWQRVWQPADRVGGLWHRLGIDESIERKSK